MKLMKMMVRESLESCEKPSKHLAKLDQIEDQKKDVNVIGVQKRIICMSNS